MKYGKNIQMRVRRHFNLQAYYLTPWWKKRSADFRKAKGKCEICGTTKKLQVHHKWYSFFREEDADLQCLCETCHLHGVHQQKGWEEMIDLDFNHQINRSQRLTHILDDAIIKQNKAQIPRNYLGASRLGVECARSLQFEFFDTQKDEGREFNGQTLRIFQVGHTLEELIINWLRLSGVNVVNYDKNNKQFGFSTANGLIKGHVDGIIKGGNEEFGPFPRLLEIKTANSKKWKEFEKNKLKKANPVYFTQIQLYLAYMGLTENPALFVAINKDTQELYFEDVPFDASVAQDASDRAVRIIQACMAGELLPREWPSEDYFQCKFCSWSNRCWHG
jgi:hypothetical protein